MGQIIILPGFFPVSRFSIEKAGKAGKGETFPKLPETGKAGKTGKVVCYD